MTSRKDVIYGVIMVAIIINFMLSFVNVVSSAANQDVCNDNFSLNIWLAIKGLFGTILSIILLCYHAGNQIPSETQRYMFFIVMGIFAVINIILMTSGSVMFYRYCIHLDREYLRFLVLMTLILDYVYIIGGCILYCCAKNTINLQNLEKDGYNQL